MEAIEKELQGIKTEISELKNFVAKEPFVHQGDKLIGSREIMEIMGWSRASFQRHRHLIPLKKIAGQHRIFKQAFYHWLIKEAMV